MTIYSEEQILMLEKGNLTCEDFQEAMCDYADGELPDSLKARVEEHAKVCRECEEFKESYLLTIKLASELKAEKPVPVEVENRLRDALNRALGLKLKQVEA